MEATCTNCNHLHQLTKNEQELISQGLRFIMLSCSNCGIGFGLNLDEQKEKEEVWRTPISGCEGFVSKIEDSEQMFYGCGETGKTWKTKKELFNSIDLIIKQYPHRRHSYIKVRDNWIHNENEPDNMDDVIQTKENHFYAKGR